MKHHIILDMATAVQPLRNPYDFIFALKVQKLLSQTDEKVAVLMKVGYCAHFQFKSRETLSSWHWFCLLSVNRILLYLICKVFKLNVG